MKNDFPINNNRCVCFLGGSESAMWPKLDNRSMRLLPETGKEAKNKTHESENSTDRRMSELGNDAALMEVTKMISWC